MSLLGWRPASIADHAVEGTFGSEVGLELGDGGGHACRGALVVELVVVVCCREEALDLWMLSVDGFLRAGFW